jgi:hypothetical protein
MALRRRPFIALPFHPLNTQVVTPAEGPAKMDSLSEESNIKISTGGDRHKTMKRVNKTPVRSKPNVESLDPTPMAFDGLAINSGSRCANKRTLFPLCPKFGRRRSAALPPEFRRREGGGGGRDGRTPPEIADDLVRTQLGSICGDG